MNSIKYFSVFLFLIFGFSVHAAEMGVPIQLKLKSPSGTYPTESGVGLKVLVLSPGTSCILREENFLGQTITNGSVSLSLGSGTRGSQDPNLSLNQVYDNSKTKTGLACVDANNNVVSLGQTYTPTSIDQRVIRIATTVSSEFVLVNFNMKASPYAIQAESVGGKVAADIVVNDATTQMNQSNLNDLLFDITRFNNLKNLAVSGAANTATTATNFTGALAGDVSGTQSATSVDKIKGVNVSGTPPTTNQVLQYNGAQWAAASLPAAPVTSVAGRTGAVTLSSADISGLGSAAGLNYGTSAGNVPQLDGSARLLVSTMPASVLTTSSSVATDVNAATSTNTLGTIMKRDASGSVAVSNISSTSNSTQNIFLYESTNTNRVHIMAPASFSNYNLVLPTSAGSAGQVLRTDGSGNLSWVTASAGSVTAVTASAPLVSSGGASPNITIAQASASASGYLSSADFTTFSNKQSSLGFTPLNPANNLSDLASASVARTNLGLGGAAVLNVGTVAGSVAAGDDARITGALQSSAFNAYVGSASCAPSESLYWNSVSSTFSCQSIAISVSEVSGITFGTAAGTFAQGNDSRIVNALQPATVHSGDVSGAYNALSVNRIRGVLVSATAPTTNQVLQYDGSQYVPVAIPSAPVSSVAGKTGAVTLSSSDISGLSFGTAAGTFAQGNDSRIVNALQPATVHSGDVSGAYNALSVNRIRGISVSATAPTTNQVLQFDGSQYVPVAIPSAPVSSVAGKTGAVTLSSSDISGLSFGTAAGTFAQGNDSRFSDSRAPNGTAGGDLSGTYPNPVLVNVVTAGTSSKVTYDAKGRIISAAALNSSDITTALGFTPISSAPVSSVAGRTGAVVLSSSDISGLTFGTAAGTFAQGNDSRITGALQASSAFSGDVSGTSSTISVNRVRGIAVSATAPTTNQVLQYNGTQYVPVTLPAAPVTTVAGRTGAVVLSSSDISGLSFGTAAGTFAQGNDSRITGALQGSAFNTYVASANCTTSQSMYWNSVSSTFSCQTIAFPAAPVSSVAGRTGAVVLSSSDVSGLGNAAALNVGTAAGSVAAGDDSRLVNALQVSTVHSGDVSGAYNSLSVDKIKGRSISSTAPVAGQALVYDGTQWVPTTGFPRLARITANQTFSSNAVADVTNMSFTVAAGRVYKYKFNIIYTSAATTTGLRLGLTYPAVTSASALANIASGADGTGAYFQGLINTSGDSVVSTSSPSATLMLYSQVEGIIVPSAAGTVQLRAASEVNFSNIVILVGSSVEVTELP